MIGIFLALFIGFFDGFLISFFIEFDWSAFWAYRLEKDRMQREENEHEYKC